VKECLCVCVCVWERVVNANAKCFLKIIFYFFSEEVHSTLTILPLHIWHGKPKNIKFTNIIKSNLEGERERGRSYYEDNSKYFSICTMKNKMRTISLDKKMHIGKFNFNWSSVIHTNSIHYRWKTVVDPIKW
jgi:hypothetical protein